MFCTVELIVIGAPLGDVLVTLARLPAKFLRIFVVDGRQLELCKIHVHDRCKFDNWLLFFNVESVDGLVAVDVLVLLGPKLFDAEELLVTPD